MLTITVPRGELYDDATAEFINVKETVLCLEHSLVSISKWEAKWHKPFLDSRESKSYDEILDYVRCMTITQNVDPNVYRFLSNKNMADIKAYIDDTMTATWFSDDKNRKSRNKKIITSEVIYYWMVSLQIPFECQRWHINRLLTLIRVCNEENKSYDGKKKRSKKEFLSNRAALNAARKKQLNTKG